MLRALLELTPLVAYAQDYSSYTALTEIGFDNSQLIAQGLQRGTRQPDCRHLGMHGRDSALRHRLPSRAGESRLLIAPDVTVVGSPAFHNVLRG